MFGSRKFHFTHQNINFLKVKFKISVLSVSSVVKFLVFSVDSSMTSLKEGSNFNAETQRRRDS